MNLADALGVVELVEVNWPRTALQDDTKQAWASLIADTEPNATATDGYEAVRDLAAHQKFPPALAEVIYGIYAARLARQQREPRYPALPGPVTDDSCSFAEFLHDNPDMGERVKALAEPAHKDDCVPPALVALIKGQVPR